MIDTQKIERIAPDYWMNSHLSIARYYGGCKINNIHYVLCPLTNYLVREDIWKEDLKQQKVKEAEKKKWMTARQMKLIGE